MRKGEGKLGGVDVSQEGLRANTELLLSAANHQKYCEGTLHRD